MAQEVYYRPPAEAESFIVRVMEGCPHNRCAFCNMFKDIPCRVLPDQEIRDTMAKDAAWLGPERVRQVKSIYLEGGDPLSLGTGELLEIMAAAREFFPEVTRFACYATARFTVKKTDEELGHLAGAGLETVYVGLESGSDAILEATGKGCTTADLLKVSRNLGAAGIGLDVSMMLGIGGRSYSIPHAEATAHLLNLIQPECVRIRTFIPKKGTPLGDAYMEGNFQLPGVHETIRELRLLVSRITARTRLLSEHWSNFILFDAYMPEARLELLKYIDRHLLMPESAFRKTGMDEARS